MANNMQDYNEDEGFLPPHPIDDLKAHVDAILAHPAAQADGNVHGLLTQFQHRLASVARFAWPALHGDEGKLAAARENEDIELQIKRDAEDAEIKQKREDEIAREQQAFRDENDREFPRDHLPENQPVTPRLDPNATYEGLSEHDSIDNRVA